jgi:hypothetical protein
LPPLRRARHPDRLQPDVCKANQIGDRRIDGDDRKIADAALTITTPCSLTVLATETAGKAVTVKAGGLGAGKVTIRGADINTMSRTVAASTVTASTPATRSRHASRSRSSEPRVEARGRPRTAASPGPLDRP